MTATHIAPSTLGFTERVLVLVKENSAQGKLNAYQAKLNRMDTKNSSTWGGFYTSNPQVTSSLKKGESLYLVQGAWNLGSDDFHVNSTTNICVLRMNHAKVDATVEQGSWEMGEKTGANWTFTLPNQTIRIYPLSEEFKPTEAKAVAFQAAQVVKHRTGIVGGYPMSLGGILAYARSGYEIKGAFKFPMWPYAVYLRGVELKPGRIYFESLNEVTCLGDFRFQEHRFSDTRITAGFQRTSFLKSKLRLMLDEDGLKILYESPKMNPEGDLFGQSEAAGEVPLEKLVPLPSLEAAALAKKLTTAWIGNDEIGGFLNDADEAYVKAGLSVVVPPPSVHSANKDVEALAKTQLDPLGKRLKRFGAKYELMQVEGK